MIIKQNPTELFFCNWIKQNPNFEVILFQLSRINNMR